MLLLRPESPGHSWRTTKTVIKYVLCYTVVFYFLV